MAQQLALEVAGQPKAQTGMELMQTALQMAITQGAALEVVDRLIKGQREAQEYAAKVDWNDAMNRCQTAMKHIGRDATSDKGKYASYAQLDKCLRPIYMAEGFSLSFNEETQANADLVRVVCTVALGGHERVYKMDIPADGKGARGGDVMTKTHAHGSAVSYGKRYLLNMIFNVAVGDVDDDGKAAGGKLSDPDYLKHEDSIKNAANDEELKQVYNAALNAAKASGDAVSAVSFSDAKNARWRDLHKGAK